MIPHDGGGSGSRGVLDLQAFYGPLVGYTLPRVLFRINGVERPGQVSTDVETMVVNEFGSGQGELTLDDIARNDAFTSFPILRTESPIRSSITLLAQCRALGLDVPPLSTTPATAPIPTLILSGEYDATTAPSWAKAAAASLPDATNLLIPEAGHAATRWSACARALATAFIADPAVTPDSSCLASERAPFLT